MNGSIIALLRYQTGLNQQQFAVKVGLSLSVLSKVEAGFLPVSRRTKMKIYQACKFDDEFMELVKRMQLYDKLLEGDDK
ncbi:helix-turn-helix transcriptional regulator [Neobacillus cucumis]|nr:helix-turn-helix transcriptional regulator [Neobacillus cucumis]